MKSASLLAAAFLVLLTGLTALAHSASTSWASIRTTGDSVSLRLELELQDLDDALQLDRNRDQQLTWGELRTRHADITRFVLAHLELASGSVPIPLQPTTLQIREHLGMPCAVLDFSAALPAPAERLNLHYRLFLDRDPLHRCIVSVRDTTTVLAPGNSIATFSLEDAARSPAPSGLFPLLREGMHHIWTGYDHLAFLFALLLPAVLQRTPEGWRGAPRLTTILAEVVRVVTAFAVAHSVTLALAAFDVVRLPQRLVEATIAASILVAVGLVFTTRRISPDAPPASRHTPWIVAFGFGLIHGFGFAGVLSELDLSAAGIAIPLLGFNLGVELGQLLCILAFLPLAYAVRNTRFYRLAAWPAGSAAIVLVATGWFIERSLDLRFMPF